MNFVAKSFSVRKTNLPDPPVGEYKERLNVSLWSCEKSLLLSGKCHSVHTKEVCNDIGCLLLSPTVFQFYCSTRKSHYLQYKRLDGNLNEVGFGQKHIWLANYFLSFTSQTEVIMHGGKKNLNSFFTKLVLTVKCDSSPSNGEESNNLVSVSGYLVRSTCSPVMQCQS